MEQEIWKPVVGYEGLYEVSNLGRVKSLAREVYRRKMGIKKVKECILKPKLCDRGYYSVALCRQGYKNKTAMVHKLVARAFIPNIENKPIIDHINGIKTDNRVDNLRWCTHIENCNFELAIKHNSESKLGKKNGMYGRSGIDSPSHKPVIQYDLQGNFLRKFYGIAEAQKETGIIFQNISKVCKGKRNSAGGYIWRYENEMIIMPKPISTHKTKRGIIKLRCKKKSKHRKRTTPTEDAASDHKNFSL